MATKKAARKGAPSKKAKAAAPKRKSARPAPAKPKKAAPKRPARAKVVAKAKAKAPVRAKAKAPARAKAKPPTRAEAKAPVRAKAALKVKAPPPKPKRKAPKIKPPPPPPPFIAVGDWVSFRPGTAQLGGAPLDGEVTQGIVCSVREIATGKFVARSRENLESYLLEVLHLQTFRPQFSSNRNAGPAQASRNPAWRRIQEILRNAAKERRFFSYASGGLPDDLFGNLLDGWRVVRARAAAVEYRE